MIWIALALPPLIWGLMAALLDAYGRRAIPPGSWDGIIVPGCKVRADGSPSAALERRVRHAVSLWRAERAPFLVLTGGVGTHPPAEAAVAQSLAESLGVPSAAILAEKRSTSTRENAAFSAALIHNGRPISSWRVLVVSDCYHAWRCGRLFRRHFASAIGRGSVPGRRLRIRGSLREVLSILREIVENPW